MTSKVTLTRWTQSSGPLWLWQCFLNRAKRNSVIDYWSLKLWWNINNTMDSPPVQGTLRWPIFSLAVESSWELYKEIKCSFSKQINWHLSSVLYVLFLIRCPLNTKRLEPLCQSLQSIHSQHEDLPACIHPADAQHSGQRSQKIILSSVRKYGRSGITWMCWWLGWR